MPSWQRSNQRSFCDSTKRVGQRRDHCHGYQLLQRNWDSCGFPARPSITAARINGENLNDETISHEQTILLSPGQGVVWKVTWVCRDFTAAIWNLVLHQVASPSRQNASSPNVFLSVTFGSAVLPQDMREHNGNLTKRQALGHLIGETQPFFRLQ